MLRGSRQLVVLLGFFAAACFDPLYEDGQPLTSRWVNCCNEGTVNTCFCEDARTCEQTFFACAEGRCTTNPQCVFPVGGGSGTSDAGPSFGGGGMWSEDAGSITGGGSGTYDAGSPTGGGGGSMSSYELCCVNARVTTCECASSGCSNAPFTPCAGNACVSGNASAACR